MGKTTLAAARAVAAADRGRRVLAVSTDPAHSLGDALDADLGPEPAAVPLDGAGGELAAVELAAKPAFERWMGARRAAFRTLAERGSVLTGEEADRLLALPLPGVDELLALLEVARLARAGGRDEVVVDTAPTAHTLRLLALPAALVRLAAVLDALDERRRVLAETFGRGEAGADPLIAEIEDDARRVEALLRDPDRAGFSWVLLPELLSLRETEDALAALGEAGVVVRELVVNRVVGLAGGPGGSEDSEGPDGGGEAAGGFRSTDGHETGAGGGCEVCAAREAAEREVVDEVRRRFPHLPVAVVPERADEPRGVVALRRLAKSSESAEGGPRRSPLPPAGERALRTTRTGGELEVGDEPRPSRESRPSPPSSRAAARGRAARGIRADRSPAWFPALAPPGLRLLFFGGKGGVGKTTCAAAVALAAAAADPSRRVRLLSTDPAHSLADVLDAPLGDDERPLSGGPENLTARELDAPRRWRELRTSMAEEVEGLLAWEGRRGGAAATLDRRLVERLLDATPPGLDELMALASLTEAAGSPVAGAGEPGGLGPLDADAAPGERTGSGPHDAGAGTADPGARAELLVVDTAATGHALRLLEMPELALRWDHALLSLLLDYRGAARLGRLAEELVALSRSLKRLRATLADPARARFVAVTRAAELPRRETARLLAALDELAIAVPAVVVNRLTEPSAGCPRCTAAVEAEAAELGRIEALAAAGAPRPRAILRAPAAFPPPRGPVALLRWIGAWDAALPDAAAGSAGAPREETDLRT